MPCGFAVPLEDFQCYCLLHYKEYKLKFSDPLSGCNIIINIYYMLITGQKELVHIFKISKLFLKTYFKSQRIWLFLFIWLIICERSHTMCLCSTMCVLQRHIVSQTDAVGIENEIPCTSTPWL